LLAVGRRGNADPRRLINDTERLRPNHDPGLGECRCSPPVRQRGRTTGARPRSLLSITRASFCALTGPEVRHGILVWDRGQLRAWRPLWWRGRVHRRGQRPGPAPRSARRSNGRTPVPEAVPRRPRNVGDAGSIQLTLDGPGQAVVAQESQRVTLSMAGRSSFAGLRSRVPLRSPRGSSCRRGDRRRRAAALGRPRCRPSRARRPGATATSTRRTRNAPKRTATLLVLRFRAISRGRDDDRRATVRSATTSEERWPCRSWRRALGIV